MLADILSDVAQCKLVQDMTVPLSEHTVMRGQLVLLGAERVLSLFASLFGLSSCRNSVDVSLQKFFSILSDTRMRKVKIRSRP
jgi:hypothetical protein